MRPEKDSGKCHINDKPRGTRHKRLHHGNRQPVPRALYPAGCHYRGNVPSKSYNHRHSVLPGSPIRRNEGKNQLYSAAYCSGHQLHTSRGSMHAFQKQAGKLDKKRMTHTAYEIKKDIAAAETDHKEQVHDGKEDGYPKIAVKHNAVYPV